MRVLTFSVLRSSRLYRTLWIPARPLSKDSASTAAEADPDPPPECQPNLLEFSASWPAHAEPELRTRMLSDMRVLENFVTEQEEQAIMGELEPVFKRMRYEYDHWDDAIHGFRETERRAWSEPAAAAVMTRVLAAAFSSPGCGEPLPHQHVLDLAPAGHIKPHVDAVRFCGEVIAGVCLLSDAVMRLVHQTRPELTLHALLPRRGLYIMRGAARYQFSHAVEGNAENMFRGHKIIKRRRVAVITRSRPKPEDTA